MRPTVEAEIVRRLQGIHSAMPGNRPCTWYVHLDQLEAVQQAFPNASYAPNVWAAYPVQPLCQSEGVVQSSVQGALWDVESIRAKEQRMDAVRGRGRYGKRKAKA